MSSEVRIAGRLTVDQIRELVGTEFGVSDWRLLDQDRINAFADVTEDHQFIHIDPVAAAETPFGGTIAHGFLTLSMLSVFCDQVRPEPVNLAHSVNYGFDRLRFVSPVPSGARIRGRFVLTEADESVPGQVTLRYGVTVEIEGADRPALVADWITRLYLVP